MRKTFASVPQRASHFLLVKVVVLIILESLLTSPVAVLNTMGQSVQAPVRHRTPLESKRSAQPVDNPAILTVFSNPASISIPEFTTNSAQSNITVSGTSGPISTITLTLTGLTSPDTNELDLLLVGPGGQKYIFMADVGGFLAGPVTNLNITINDAAASQLPDNGVLTSGSWRPANYSDIGDAFPSPAPAGPYSSAGPEGVPPLTLLNVFGGLSGASVNGTWSLFVADNINLGQGSSSISGGWSLDIVTTPAALPTTTVVSGSPNPSFTNQAVTITSTTTSSSTVNTGTVTFVDTTTSVTLCSNVAVNGSGQAQCVVPANTLSERRHTIQATYAGNATFATSNGNYVQTVNCPTTIASNTFTNGCGITLADAGPNTSIPYPSNIIVSGLSGSISKVTLTLTNATFAQTSDQNFLLVGPAGQTFVFMSDAGGSVASSGVTLTFDDAAINALPSSGSIASGSYRPTNYNVDAEAWPSPAPAGPYNNAAPTGSATFASVYGGAAPNGTWSLYPIDDSGSSGAAGTIGSWSLTFTTTGDAPTTTTVSGNPNPSTTAQSFLVTANVTSTSTVNSGTVTFRRGATILCATVPVVSGTATCNVAALPQGDYVITADYNGSPGVFNISSGNYTQQVNSPTVVTCNNFANNGGITVANSSTGNPYPSRILVSGLGGTITKVTVTVSGLTDATPEDLDLLLVGPGGQTLLFMGDAGGANAISNVNLTFDDAAASQVPDSTLITSGTFRPASWTGFDSFPAPAPASITLAAPEGAGTLATAFNGIVPNGTWSLYAVEDSGDSQNATISNWSLTFTLAAVATTTTVTSSANPSVFGQPVTFTATVATAGLGTPNGNVQFFDNANPIGGPVALNGSGQAQVTTSSLTVGNHTITANYAGASSACTGTFNSSSGSLTGNPQVVNKANTTVGISANQPNPVGTGVPTTFTITVSPVAPGAGTRTGTVTLSRNGSPVSSCINLAINVSGQATCTLTFTIAGTYNITAAYSGDTNFNASNNNASPYVQQVAGPTAANVGISGRVVDSNGQGVYGARISVQNQAGEVRYAITNPFGYYSVADVPAGQTYLVSVQHKRYEFAARTISVNEDLTDLDFIAQGEARPESEENPGKIRRRGTP